MDPTVTTVRLARSHDGLPQTRSSSDGCWRGRGCSGGSSAGELSAEVPGSPPVAGEADLGVVDCAADDDLVEWLPDREEGWGSDAVLDEWDSVQTSDGYATVHKTVFFPEGVDERPLDPEGQLLVWIAEHGVGARGGGRGCQGHPAKTNTWLRWLWAGSSSGSLSDPCESFAGLGSSRSAA